MQVSPPDRVESPILQSDRGDPAGWSRDYTLPLNRGIVVEGVCPVGFETLLKSQASVKALVRHRDPATNGRGYSHDGATLHTPRRSRYLTAASPSDSSQTLLASPRSRSGGSGCAGGDPVFTAGKVSADRQCKKLQYVLGTTGDRFL